ncbi:MAG TPA: AraC family transcriptional regulator [Steroidobacteraceae bacterium]|jgi:AraC-like DNA-binding protein|nr:AraC family transcriptional regulator [Steroidobacteraceae bacterium]
MFDSNLPSIREFDGTFERQQELSARVARFVPVDGTHESAVASLSLTRSCVPTVCMPTVYHPCLAIVVQGRKRALLNDEVFHYDALNYLVVSVTLPGMGQILEASAERPYLGLRLDLDLEEIARLLLELGDRGAPLPAPPDRGLFVARMDEPLLDAVLRMVRLLETPDDIAVLAPVVRREIYYRVLRGELGHRLVDLAQGGSGNNRIVRAIEWLKQRYSDPLRIEELAQAVHMSPSSLHHRFKAVTAMSPLQYQKHLRLHEARRLMFANGVDCAAAGHRVGYESASQFSREYRRLFGTPPRAEIARLREIGAVT